MASDERLQRLLGGDALVALRRRLRQRYERAALSADAPAFRIGRLSAVEHAALAALQGSSVRLASSMRVDVAAIDAALQRADVAGSLREALERLDGRIVDRAGEREAAASQWRRVIDARRHPGLAAWLQAPAGIGLLKRLAGQSPDSGAAALADAEAVLARLPASGLTRAQLAAEALGDAHALDAGCVVATLVLAVLRSGTAPNAGDEAEPDDLSARDLWAGAGVLVNELARPALVLNLPGLAMPGEPVYLSLRQLLRSPPAWGFDGRAVFVCENPNVVAIAADQLGDACAPLVCTEGMPAAAQRTLLNQLARAGAMLAYHGDFDWPGLRIGNHVMREHGARPWRFGAADYEAALAVAQQPGRLLQGAAVEPAWDDALGAAMQAARRAIDEESVVGFLLQDLATHRPHANTA